MFTYVPIRRGRWLALVLCILGTTTVAWAQIQLRGPPLNQRPPNQQVNVVDPTTGTVIQTFTIPQHVQLMPGKPTITSLNNGSFMDFPVFNNPFVFGYPPEQGGITGGALGGGIGGGGIGGGGGFGGGLSGGIGGIGGGGIGGIGGGIGGIGGGIGGIGGGGIGGIGGGGIGGFGGGLGGFGGVLGVRSFVGGGPTVGFSGFGGNFAGFGGAGGALGGGF